VATRFELAELPEPERALAAAVVAACPEAQALRFSDGEVILDASDASRDFVLLLRGCALAIEPGASPESRVGKEIGVLEARPDAPVFIGEMAALDAGCRTATIVSAMTAWLLRLPAADLDTIIEGFPGLTRALCRAFSERLRGTGEALRRARQATGLEPRVESRGAGERLFTAGEPANQLWQVIEGAVHLDSATGRHTCAPDGDTPCLLDLRAYLCGAPHPVTATTERACVLVRFGPEGRDAVVRNHPALVRALLAAP
jgi:CRP-like cAMP-binding protein